MTKITAFGGESGIPPWLFFAPSFSEESRKIIRGTNLFKVTISVPTQDGDKITAVLAITGTGFKYNTHHQPIAGTATHLETRVSGDLSFTYENFSAPLKALRDAFSNHDLLSQNFAALDKLFAFFGNINYIGNASFDSMIGSTGRDHFRGAGESDNFFGFDNNDTLDGGSGSDSLNAGFGNDKVIGGDGFDTIFGGGGNDTITAGADDDSINGGTGNDTIDAGDGGDHVEGFFGNDLMFGGLGADNFQGDSGIDTASYVKSATGISLTSFEGGYAVVHGDAADALRSIENVIGSRLADVMAGGTAADNFAGLIGNDTLSGDTGNDTLVGDVNNDQLDGGDGNDSLDGGIDSDTIIGGAGRDTITGAAGADSIDGGTGNDSIAAGADQDTVQGGDGNDTISGGAGADQLSGGTGADRFVMTSALVADGDTITDFVSELDKIDLSPIDTKPSVPNDQPFHFIGEDPFSGTRGELQVISISAGGGPLVTTIKGDIDGNGAADFTIIVPGIVAETDFIL